MFKGVPFSEKILFIFKVYGFFQSGANKFYGLSKSHTDSFLTLSASLGAIANSIARVFWAVLYDKYGFKSTYLTMCLIQVITKKKFF